jgi:hypothetical protein
VLDYWTVGIGLAMVVSIGISSSVRASNGWKRACLRALVLCERRVIFPCACFIPSVIDTRLGREVTPRLDPRFCIKVVS